MGASGRGSFTDTMLHVIGRIQCDCLKMFSTSFFLYFFHACLCFKLYLQFIFHTPQNVVRDCVFVPCCFSHVWLFATLWTTALQAPPSMGFCRQEDWSGLSFPSSGDLSDPGLEPASVSSPALADGFFTTSTTWEALRLGLAPPEDVDSWGRNRWGLDLGV